MNAHTSAALAEKRSIDGNCRCLLLAGFLAKYPSDLLNRHRRINCLTVTRDRAKHPRSRGRSACDSCAKAKLRCSSSVPCSRCLKKGIPCERRTLERSSNPTEAAEAFPENVAHPHPTTSHQQQQHQDTDYRDLIPDLFTFTAPQTPAIPGRIRTGI